MKYLYIVWLFLLLVLPIRIFAQCNVQSSVCDIATAPSFGFDASSGAYAGGSFANAGCSTGAGGQQSYGFIILYISESGPLNLLINGNSNSGFIDVAIFNIPNGVAPCVAIQDGANAIGCNFASQAGGCVQFGNMFSCGSSVPAPSVNTGDVIMIIAQNYSFFGSSSYTLQLAANGAKAGMPDPTININTTFCTNEAPSQLTAVNNGGTWSGPDGLSPSGLLNPAVAGAGIHTVYYSIGSGECETTDNFEITIRSVAISDTNISNCKPGGLYALSGVVNIEIPPQSGDLVITNCKGDELIIASAPFTESSYYFDFNGLDGDGLSCNIHAYFTDDSCGDLVLYTAPECLSCIFTEYTIEVGKCETDNTFEVFGTISFDIEPLTGQLIIENCYGESITFNSPFESPVNYSFKKNPANGDSCFIFAHFTDDICTLQIDYLSHTTPNVSIIADTVICFGDTATIIAKGAATYEWNENLAHIDTQNVSPLTSTTYVVKGYDSNQCFSMDTVYVKVNSLPVVDFNVFKEQGCLPVNVLFTNNTLSSGFKDCLWTFSDGRTVTDCDSVEMIYNYSGLFGASLRVRSNEDCVAELHKKDIISILPLPKAQFRPLPSVYEFSDPLVYFSNFSTDASEYFWDFGINNDTSNVSDPFYIYPDKKEGIYTVTLIAFSDNGCTDSVQHTVRGEEGMIFYIPNTFTPQGDGFNDTFRPILTSGIDFTTYRFSVFDRWGKVIFETQDVFRGWDGFYDSMSAPSESYTWCIELTTKRNSEKKVYRGHVNLVR